MHHRQLLLATCALSAWALTATAVAQDWTAPLATLSPPRWDLTDPAIPLQQRIAAAQTLGRHGPAEDAETLLLAALDDGATPALRDAALQALAMRASGAAVAPALQALASTEQPAGAPFLLLSAVGNRAAIDGAIAQLRRPEMAAQAAWALRRIGPDAVPRLLAQLDEDPPPPLSTLIGALGDREAIAPLRARLDDARPARQAGLLDALAALAPDADAATGGGLETAALARVDSDRADVAAAALRLLGALGEGATAAGRAALQTHVAAGPADTRAVALAALCARWPSAAPPQLSTALHDGPDALRAAALDCLYTHPHRAFIPLLAELLRGPSIEAAASALARIRHGRGLRALLDAGTALPERAPLLGRAVAICLRRHASRLPQSQRAAGLRWLRALPAGARTLRLRALAQDPAVLDRLPALLHAQEPRALAEAALVAQWLGARLVTHPRQRGQAVAHRLCAMLRQAGRPETRRRAATALRELGLVCREAPWRDLLRQPAVAPEAALLLGATLAGAAGEGRDADRQLRAALRSALRHGTTPDARTRAGAALALALVGERSAVSALTAALSDPSDRVRLAAARALRSLGGEAARVALAQHRRVERSPDVFDAMSVRDPDHRGRDGRDSDEPLRRGREVLEVRVGAGHTPGTGGAALVEVALADGRWLLVETGEAGELILPDLAPGNADVALLR